MDIVLGDFGMNLMFLLNVIGRVWMTGIRVYWNFPHLIYLFEFPRTFSVGIC